MFDPLFTHTQTNHRTLSLAFSEKYKDTCSKTTVTFPVVIQENTTYVAQWQQFMDIFNKKSFFANFAVGPFTFKFTDQWKVFTNNGVRKIASTVGKTPSPDFKEDLNRWVNYRAEFLVQNPGGYIRILQDGQPLVSINAGDTSRRALTDLQMQIKLGVDSDYVGGVCDAKDQLMFIKNFQLVNDDPANVPAYANIDSSLPVVYQYTMDGVTKPVDVLAWAVPVGIGAFILVVGVVAFAFFMHNKKKNTTGILD